MSMDAKNRPVNLSVSLALEQNWSGGTFSKSHHCQPEFEPQIVFLKAEPNSNPDPNPDPDPNPPAQPDRAQ